MTETEEFIDNWAGDNGLKLSYRAREELLEQFDRSRPREVANSYAYEKWRQARDNPKRKGADRA